MIEFSSSLPNDCTTIISAHNETHPIESIKSNETRGGSKEQRLLGQAVKEMVNQVIFFEAVEHFLENDMTSVIPTIEDMKISSVSEKFLIIKEKRTIFNFNEENSYVLVNDDKCFDTTEAQEDQIYAEEDACQWDYQWVTVTSHGTQDTDSELAIIPTLQSENIYPYSESIVVLKEKLDVFQIGNDISSDESEYGAYAEELTCLDELFHIENLVENKCISSDQDRFHAVILRLPLTEEQIFETQYFCEEEMQIRLQDTEANKEALNISERTGVERHFLPLSADNFFGIFEQRFFKASEVDGSFEILTADETDDQLEKSAQNLHGMFLSQYLNA